MTNIHTAEFNGKTYTRTSQSRTYTHCVAVVRHEWTRDGWKSPAWEGVETWSSTKALAEKAAATLRGERHFDGTEGRGRMTGRRYISPKGNGPAIYSQVVVLPVTVATKTPKVHATDDAAAAADLGKRKAQATRRAAGNGRMAIHCIAEAVRCHTIAVEATAPNTNHANFAVYADRNEASAADYARTAWHVANERLALDIPARNPEGAIVAPTVLDVPATPAADQQIMDVIETALKTGDVASLLAADLAIGRLDATLVGATHLDGTPAFPALDAQAADDTRIGCGCCRGPESDRCCCWMHQDAPRGILPKTCSRHRPAVEGVVIDARGPASYTVITEGVEMTGLSPDAAREIYRANTAAGASVLVMKEGGAQ